MELQLLCMNYGEEEIQLSSTFMSLEVNSIFWMTVRQEGSGMLRVMKESLWDTLLTVKHIEYSTPEPR